jgi:hypothetical protein
LIALLIAAATGLGGCSWIFVKPLPPDYESGDAVDCTTDRTAPVIDTLFSISEIAGIAYVSSKSNDQNKNQVNSLVTGQLIGLIMWGSSAIYGYRRTNACIDARSDASESYSHHLGVRHRAYGPPSPVAPPPAAAPAGTAPAPEVAPVVTPQRAPAPQQGDDEKPTIHSAPANKPWTLPQDN